MPSSSFVRQISIQEQDDLDDASMISNVDNNSEIEEWDNTPAINVKTERRDSMNPSQTQIPRSKPTLKTLFRRSTTKYIESKVPLKLKKAKKNKSRMIYQLGESKDIDIDNMIEARLQNTKIFRTYEKDYSNLSVFESDFTRMQRSIKEHSKLMLKTRNSM